MRTLSAQISITIVCLLLGVAIVVQFRTQGNIVNKILVDSSTEQATMINGLVASNASLRKEVDSLDARLSQYQGGKSEGNIQTLASDLNQIKAVNGLLEVSGPGIELTLSGGPLAPEEVEDVINELRNAGAEALALNGHRIVVNSVVSLDSNGATLDGQPLLPPYHFIAIGDPETLAPAVDRKGGLVPALLANHPGMQMSMQKSNRLVAPIYERKMQFRYAKPVVNQTH